MFRERLYGYLFGITAGLATIAALYVGYAPWLALLIVLCWAARRRVAATPTTDRHTNEYGEVWDKRESILAVFRRFVAEIIVAEQASAAPCPACGISCPAHYRYCDHCGAVMEVWHGD